VYIGPGGAQSTQVIMGQQMFDARTGTLKPLPNVDKTGMFIEPVMAVGAIPVSANVSLQYISPH
jgi:hypothetical protein